MAALFVLVLAILSPTLFAQAATSGLSVVQSSGLSDSLATEGTPLTITLQDALERARVNDTQYDSALTDLGVARGDRTQARAAMLPNVSYNNSFLYTEGTGQPPACALSSTCPSIRFIANNGVHEYISQANAHEALSLTNFGDYRRSGAAVAQARAKAEIAARGLVVTVTQAYYGLIAAQRKYATAQRADAEARRFQKISQDLQNGGEVARADVVKANIQAQQRQRDLQEAQLEMQKSRLDLAVLIFSEWNQNFSVVDDLQTPEPLPGFADVEAAGKKNNPQLKSALAALSAELSHEQRQLLAHLREFYEEASTARSEMESLASSAEMAADSLRLTNLRYQAGESTVLEIVDAQNTLTQARNAYDDGQVRYRVAVANLQTLTGSF
jgi:outer membrane protein TolC